jgi:hypothetical protein
VIQTPADMIRQAHLTTLILAVTIHQAQVDTALRTDHQVRVDMGLLGRAGTVHRGRQVRAGTVHQDRVDVRQEVLVALEAQAAALPKAQEALAENTNKKIFFWEIV